ncbi:nuclear transport factor 2 family protein [Bradyrhizobium elkanii]
MKPSRQLMLARFDLTNHFDEMAAVVDWLDCCRSHDLEALLDLYADQARLECACEGSRISGRSALADYWRPKLSTVAADAFGLEEITPQDDGVVLDYLSYEGKRVRIMFVFDALGKISHMRCAPSSR